MVRRTEEHMLTFNTNSFVEKGNFMQADAPEMLSLEIVEGAKDGLKDLNSIMKVYMDDLDNTLNHIRQTFKSVAPSIPFQYHFLDDSYDQLYKSEQRLGQVFTIFTILAILIACIGLFGLVSYSVVQRTKEIGIRKVLGASVIKIIKLLSKDFLKPVIIAFALAFPIAWYAMQQWLNDFAYRVSLPWWVFVFVAFMAIGISIVTVSFQSIKAALANPVDSLRNE